MTTPRDVFARLRARAGVGIAVEAAACVAAALAVFVFASLLIDRSLRLEVGYRFVLLLALGAWLAHIVYRRYLLPRRVRLDDEELALAVERADPELRQSLISAVQFGDALAADRETTESRELMADVVRDVERRVDGLGLDRALDAGRVRRFGLGLAAAVALPTGWAALDPQTAQLWAKRNLLLSTEEWPRATRLAFVGVDGDVVRVAEGDDQTVVVAVEGAMPEQAELHYRFDDAGGAGVEAMTQTAAAQFGFTFEALVDSVEVHVEAGDGSTPSLRLEVVPRPVVRELSVEIEYPAYMERPVQPAPDTEGDLQVPRGAALHVVARCSAPLRGAYLEAENGERTTLAVDGAETARGLVRPEDTGVLTLHLRDQHGLDSARPPRLFVRLVEDAAPRIDYRAAGIGSMIAPTAVIPGELTITDDYGLRAVGASFRVTGDPEAEAAAAAVEPVDEDWAPADVPALREFGGGGTEFTTTAALDLAPLNPNEDPAAVENAVRPGQMLSVRFSATDNFGPGEPHVGYSQPLVFRVVTRERLLTDLTRRQVEQRRELERIVAEEKTDVAELREILSPDAEDERAERARLRLLGLARKQRASGKRVLNIADHVTQILDELQNNRLLEPGAVTALRSRITEPLNSMAAEDFPRSADAVAAFAGAGEEDLRSVAVSTYDALIPRLEQVLEQMVEMESFATLIEALRRVIKMQNSAIELTDERRDAAAGSLFDPPGDGSSARKPPGSDENRNKPPRNRRN